MRVLVSTSDKTGLLEFLKPLVGLGLEVVSTGGTYEYLKNNNIPVIEVSEVTQFPEVLDGRVKTLHPFIHMGLLADQKNPEHVKQLKEHKVKAFDMVIGNLYPFEKTAMNENATFEELIENIDIGGPSFLRASAKNYGSVAVVCSIEDYGWVQQKILGEGLSEADRKKLALKVFSLTSYYDALIVQKLGENVTGFEYLNLPLKRQQSLRYGENPHQAAVWYQNPIESKLNLTQMVLLQGKELSYNNLLDLEASTRLVRLLSQPGCVAVKHNNPCGAAVDEQLFKAAHKAIESDPKSIFGGIIAFNRKLDLKTAELFKNIFLECIIAPEFEPEVLSFFATKKNLRLLSWPQLLKNVDLSVQEFQLRSVAGGILRQQNDSFRSDNWQFIGEKPNDSLMKTMIFGDTVSGALKSNAIAIVANGQTIGLGMGQVNRVDAVQQAVQRMNEFKARHNLDMSQVVLVSDAFFPFPDSVDLIAAAEIKWILQPGGSVQDAAVIEAAQNKNLNMVLTHLRHFKH